MKFSKALMSSAVVVAAFTGTQAFAAEAAASPLTYSGVVDFSYDYAENDGVNLRQFDVEDDAFVLHQVNLSASKAFDGGIGATVNAVLGEDANLISGDGDQDDFDLTQAYLSKSLGNLTVIAGRFVTLAGMEVINPSGNINASRSLLFVNQPFVHTGVRATYKLSDMLSFTGGINNSAFGGTKAAGKSGAGPVDNNSDQTIEAQIAFAPLKTVSSYLTFYTGNEDGAGVGFPGAELRYDTVDLVVNFNLTDTIYLGLNADYFRNEDGAGGSIEATGVAGYAQVKILPKLRVAARSEYYAVDAFDGLGMSTGDDVVRTNTLTLGHACSDNLELIVEGRHDRSSSGFKAFQNISDAIGSADEDQYTGTIKAILKF